MQTRVIGGVTKQSIEQVGGHQLFLSQYNFHSLHWLLSPGQALVGLYYNYYSVQQLAVVIDASNHFEECQCATDAGVYQELGFFAVPIQAIKRFLQNE